MDKLIKELTGLGRRRFLDNVVEAITCGYDDDEDFGMVEIIDKDHIFRGKKIEELDKYEIINIIKELNNNSEWIKNNIEYISEETGIDNIEIEFNIAKFSDNSCGLEVYFG